MIYTKTQLIEAFCAVKGCKVSELPDIKTEIQERLNNTRNRIQTRLDNVPATAKEQIKKVALEYLNKQNSEKSIIDNMKVEL